MSEEQAKIAKIRQAVEQYETTYHEPTKIKTSLVDSIVSYQAKIANTQAIEIAKILLAEIDRLQDELQSSQQEIERLKSLYERERDIAEQAQQEVEKLKSENNVMKLMLGVNP